MAKEKWITTGMMVVLVIGLLTGCGSKDAKADGTANTAKDSASSVQGTQSAMQNAMQDTTQNPDSQQNIKTGQNSDHLASLPETPASDFEYEEIDGKITIKHYTGKSMEIAIPAQIDGKDVTVIGDYCFANSDIVAVVCPNTLETIEEFAFANCYELAEISLNEGLQNIGKDAFLYCESLEYINIPSTLVFIGEIAFSGAGIKEINLLCGSVECVNGGFFNIDIEKLTIPSNMKIIGYAMFAGCKSLETVVIEEGVEKIDIRAFSSCESLKKVSIPASVTEIGEKVFDKTNDALVLTVQPGSYAESYAKENGIAYVNP